MNELVTLFIVLIACFLFGMAVMRIGLETVSKNHMQKVLYKMTDRHWKSFLCGIVLTAFIQSSSAVIAIVIGLVTTKTIRFRQSVGVILGANIGTTLTTEIITLNISDAVVPLLLIGGGLLFFPGRRVFFTGCIVFGLGAIFTAVNGLENLAEPLKHLQIIHHLLLIANQHHASGAVIGMIFTAIIQSSSAATGVFMAFMANGSLSLSTAIALILGANIGTCFTAFLAAVGANRQARMAAYLHVGFNTAGVLLFLPVVDSLALIARYLADAPPSQLAHISVLFNVICAVAALPLANKISRYCERLLAR